ncbi:hypothetical protein D3C76_620580 [compost metagenome]
MNLLRILDVQVLALVVLEVIVEILVVLVVVVVHEQHPTNLIPLTLGQVVARLPLRRGTRTVDGLAQRFQGLLDRVQRD